MNDKKKYITIHCKRKDHIVEKDKILYVLMNRSYAAVHVYGGEVYITRRTYKDFVKNLGNDFIEIKRGCIISVMAIQNITKQGVELINGEFIKFSARRKKEVKHNLNYEKERIIAGYAETSPRTAEDYHNHYMSFDSLPFAFTDIELVYNKERQAVDWIFRYGNDALAKLEMIPLEKLIGSSFGSLFENMDKKWLINYERSAIFGEILEIMDYSPEVRKNLKIISFPTFKGHCGCIMFDMDEIKFTGIQDIVMSYVGIINKKNESDERNDTE